MSLLHGVGSGLGGSGDAGGALGSFFSHTVDHSLRLNGTDAYLSKTNFGTATNTSKRTFSTWIKTCDDSYSSYDHIVGAGSSNIDGFGFDSNAKFAFLRAGADIQTGTAQIRDVSAWMHVMFTWDSTAGNWYIYINGVQDSTGTASAALTKLGQSGQTNTIGKRSNAGQYIHGYLAQTVFLDGTIGSVSDFGETKDGIWIPKDISAAGLTFGTNGYFLDYADSSDLGKDVSGQGNHWTSNNLAAEDQVPDSPTNNFAVLNVLDKSIGSPTISEGNLKISGSGSGYDGTYATIAVTSGKWYAEFLYISGDNRGFFGIAREERLSYVNSGSYLGNILDTYGLDFRARAYTGTNATSSSGVQLFDQTNFDTGDIGLLCFDVDAGKLWFGRRDVSGSTTIWYDSSGNNNGDPSAGSNPTYTFTATGSTWYIGCHDYAGTGLMANFGQDGSFAGEITSQGVSDANGIGDFNYIEDGFLALCTSNLPDITIGPGQGTQADDNFNTVLWTGNGTDGRTITGVNFAADMVWVKSRSVARSAQIQDIVRGFNDGTKVLRPNKNAKESDVPTDQYGFVGTINSDGYTLEDGTSDGVLVNNNGETYVGWNWKAGGSASSNSDGSITSSVSANTAAGFSIVSYTGTGSNGTIGHGLTSAPESILIKARTRSENWLVYHKFDGGTDGRSFLNLNLTDDKFDNGASGYFQGTPPTDSVFYQNGSSYNVSTDTYIAYCFHSVEGYSKFGSFQGNSSADGTFVFCGFRPAYVWLKRADANGVDWSLFDSKRLGYNVDNNNLRAFASSAATEQTDDDIDFVSNGFKCRRNFANNQGHVIFFAWAEAPFKFANAR